jgi:hypothetical protein
MNAVRAQQCKDKAMRRHFSQEPSRKPFNRVDNQRAANPNKRRSYKNL